MSKAGLRVATQDHPLNQGASSDAFFRLLVENVTDYAIFALDPQGFITTWNKGAERLSGYLSSEIIGEHFSKFFLEKDIEAQHPQHALQQAVDTGSWTGEGWRVRKDGSRFWASVVITRLSDERGKLVGFVKVTRDLTERKMAEEKLRQVNERLEARVIERTRRLEEVTDRYRSLTNSLPQMIWTAGADGSVNYANEQCLRYTGMSTAEKLGDGWVAMIHPEDLSRVAEAWNRSMITGSVFTEEYRIRRNDGEYRWFLGRSVPVKNSAGVVDYWIGTATDIEDQKQVISRLEAERRLREQFVATLTHDLRNPLSSVKISAQMIGRLSSSPEKLTSLSGKIVEHVSRANQMIENLLDVTRIRAGESLQLDMQEMSLVPVVKDTLTDLSTVHGDRFVLLTNDPSITGVWNSDAVRRILENLCNNAIKYGSDSGSVTVVLERTDSKARIKVHNVGNPIPPEMFISLFEPFQGASASGNSGHAKGWGLGLALVKALAEAHGGSVSVESSPEAGTTFVVEI